MSGRRRRAGVFFGVEKYEQGVEKQESGRQAGRAAMRQAQHIKHM
jgi:hypothetical protein